ncbi:gliding motility-associated C-terminal domain-containing protein [Cochleicola gelatinilyticus]|uniref:T9SS-like galactose binding domain-containing protein n=1 Tax=Cochleicola gelatinilyticus TaxID=1763537 RepID=A0A167IWP5_9FLAO|nr:gliding motility-associated C-terminal domain-containing protein [Cochleicola gelatinilyticus]OAB80090.1 hypothetical protein ULVI_04945 [Cochleicola gelatinilyticus]
MNKHLHFVFALFILSSFSVFSQVPVNDLCEDAIEIMCGDTVTGNTEQSTSTGAPTATCGTTSGAPGNWYSFTGTGDIIELSMCDSDYDTKIQVYSGDCDNLVCIGGDDDGCDGSTRSEFTFLSEEATEYFVYAYGWNIASGDYTLSITCTPPPSAPENDDCDGAIDLTVNTDENCTEVTSATIAGGTPSTDMNDCGGTANDDVWFSFEATAENHRITLSNIVGNTTDLYHSVYEGECGTLTNLTCSDPNTSVVQDLTIGNIYLIRVYSFNDDILNDTTFDICVSLLPPPPENDECEAAIMLDVNVDDTCTLTTSGTVEAATASDQDNPCGGTANDDVWYSFEATAENHSITLSNIAGNTTDLYHSVYAGDCGTLTNLSCSDPNNSVLQDLTIGETYFIRVYSFNSSTTNTTTFDICVALLPPPPSNDECDAAIDVAVNLDDTCTLVTSGTIEAATASDQANSCSGTDDDDVWFQFEATSENHLISLLNASGSTTDLYHVLYEGDDCDNLTQLYCSDPNQSTASNLIIGNTYFLRVYTWTSTGNQNTTFDVCVSTVLPSEQCINADPFCSQDGLIFPNEIDGQADPGIDYECLITQPNPTWFFLQIEEAGTLDFEIIQNTSFDDDGNPNGTGLDVDFIAWGPFDSPDEDCDNLNPNTSIACSYSIDAIENFTIPNAQPGDFYVLLITNFDGAAGFISLQQTNFGEPNGGSTNCDIICEISIDGEEEQFFCDVEETTLTTTANGAFDSYEWFFNGTLIPGENEPELTITESGEYTVIANGPDCQEQSEDMVTVTFFELPCEIEPECNEVVFLEDFGEGIGSFCFTSEVTTTYDCNTPLTEVDDGEYTISNSSTGLNIGWHPNMEDHSEDDNGNGRMLFVNADFTAGEFYRRTIAINANEEYELNTWITSVYDTDSTICPDGGIPINVIMRIEDPSGNLIVETSTGTIENGPNVNWQEYFINFNSQALTEIQLVLVNNSEGGCGNDLAIDDISLLLVTPQPDIIDPIDLEVCDVDNDGIETVNLEDQIPEILNGQDPALFNISFHLSDFDADVNQNPIPNPDAYTNSSNPETIYVRVEKVEQATCFSTVDFLLTLNEIFDITTNLPTEAIFCVDDTITPLNATPTNPGIDLTDATYVWTNAVGDTVSTDAVFTPTEGGTYTVLISVPPCSDATFTVEVTLQDPPSLDLGPDAVLCDNSSFEIVPQITGDTTGITYEWSTGETTPTIFVDETGTYDLTISVGPCIVTDSIEVEIRDPLIVDVGEDFKVCRDDPNTITATTSEEGVTFQWFLNGDLLDGETNSTLTFTVPTNEFGSLTYTVEISDGDCTGSDSVDILMYDVDNCLITEGISPNGDGKNDCLDLEFLGDRQGSFSIEIFNRHGRSLFKQNNYVNEWCGQTSEGDALPTGTYYYVLKFSAPNPDFEDVMTGWVYLNTIPN